MPITIKLVSRFEVAVDGVLITGGSLSPVEITAATGIKFDRTYSIATATTKVIFLTTEAAALIDFDFLFITSTQSVYLEMATDVNNGVGDEYYTVNLAANVPFVLASDNSYANYTPNFAGGTIDVIDMLRIRNDSGSTAVVRVFAAT